jgi:uncharacterized protein
MEATKKTCTLVLTEDCNFACKYCYLVHKNRHSQMSFEVARASVDYLLEHPDLFPEDEAIWDFMGGEPLLEVDLIEQVIEYVRHHTYELDHRWFSKSWFSITTNGALYGTPKVQRLLDRFPSQIEVGLTIDGPEHVHDMERVFPDGTGTHKQVVANVPKWLERFPKAATKVTISPGNLPFLAESVLYLYSLGIHEIHANVVFENVWKPEHEPMLEEQLDRLGDAMLERGLHPGHTCSFFTKTIGNRMDRLCDNGNWCGPGKMIAIDAAGNFYPCNRFMGVSLAKRAARTVGNLRDGLNVNRVRPFLALTRSSQSPEQCMNCEIASGCAWCQGLNYDEAETATIYQRAIYICGLHKARVRATRRFWEKVEAREAAKRLAAASGSSR